MQWFWDHLGFCLLLKVRCKVNPTTTSLATSGLYPCIATCSGANLKVFRHVQSNKIKQKHKKTHTNEGLQSHLPFAGGALGFDHGLQCLCNTSKDGQQRSFNAGFAGISSAAGTCKPVDSLHTAEVDSEAQLQHRGLRVFGYPFSFFYYFGDKETSVD